MDNKIDDIDEYVRDFVELASIHADPSLLYEKYLLYPGISGNNFANFQRFIGDRLQYMELQIKNHYAGAGGARKKRVVKKRVVKKKVVRKK